MQSLYKIISLIVLTSCAYSSTDNKEKEVSQCYEGLIVNIPSEMTFQIQGDTIDYDIDNCDYKILCFIDTVGCTLCKLNYAGWEQFMSEVNSNRNQTTNFLMIINTDRPEEITKASKRYHFNYPVSFDGKIFNEVNPGLPYKSAVQTFLLDDENKVVAIGNPLYDSELRKQYKAVIGVADTSNNASAIKANPEHQALGSFKIGEMKKAKFRLFNNSSQNIVIKDIFTSCSCTSARADRDTIYADKYVDIQVICQPEKTDGNFITIVR